MIIALTALAAFTAAVHVSAVNISRSKDRSSNQFHRKKSIKMDSERYLVDYGPKSVAVFGDTKSVKDSLKARGGRFNGRLWDSTLGVAAAGWVFSAKDKESLLQEEGGLGIVLKVGTIAAPSKEPGTTVEVANQKNKEVVVFPAAQDGGGEKKNSERYLVDYGPKSVAVFGDTKSVKDSLKARGGRFNGRLWDSTLGVAAAGWVFSAKDKESLLQEEGGLGIFLKKGTIAAPSKEPKIPSEAPAVGIEAPSFKKARVA